MSAAKNIQVLFHRDHDGVASAYCAWLIFGDAAEYHSVQYGEDFPEIPDDSRVFILDFSWPHKATGSAEIADGIYALAQRCRELVIIDHHAGPVEDALVRVDEWMSHDTRCVFQYRFDRTKAGVELAWDFFRAYSPEATASWQEKIPYPLQLIADRDLWRHENDPDYSDFGKRDCQTLHEGLFLIPFKWGTRHWFEKFHHACTDSEAFSGIIIDGIIALRVRQAAVESLIKNAYIAPYKTGETDTGAMSDVIGLPTVESALWQSEIAHALLQKYPNHRAAVVRYRKPAPTAGAVALSFKVVHSIRSHKGDDTALRIALANGGGGHPQAAGFTTEEAV